MTIRKLVVTFGAVALLALSAGSPANAIGTLNKTTYLTFNRPVRLPGVTLGTGTYVFEIVNPTSTADVVAVFSRDHRHSYFLGLTRGVARPAGARGESPITFGEAARDEAVPITAWYPLGESIGREFLYR